jgi:two-component system sensor histidine kinase KdpD
VLCFNFFFVPPRYTFAVEHPQYVVTFLVMLAVALTISHLTVRVRAQADAAKRSEITAETERLRSSLLSAVSHELKTPLTAIIGSAGSLLQAPADGGGHRRELLENIREEAERLARLVHNLIETTRLESGTVRLKKEPYPIEDVIGTALERLDKPLTGREVQTDLPEDLPLVPVDPVLMELVFVNLIENALRHAPGGAAIEIAARKDAGSLEVSVADRGPGLSAESIQRVFEKFYRAGPAAGGAGLGLAICKAVVEAHGGTIRAENRPCGGALFRLSLPCQDGP